MSLMKCHTSLTAQRGRYFKAWWGLPNGLLTTPPEHLGRGSLVSCTRLFGGAEGRPSPRSFDMWDGRGDPCDCPVSWLGQEVVAAAATPLQCPLSFNNMQFLQVPGTLLGARGSSGNKTKIPVLKELTC